MGSWGHITNTRTLDKDNTSELAFEEPPLHFQQPDLLVCWIILEVFRPFNNCSFALFVRPPSFSLLPVHSLVYSNLLYVLFFFQLWRLFIDGNNKTFYFIDNLFKVQRVSSLLSNNVQCFNVSHQLLYVCFILTLFDYTRIADILKQSHT